MAQLLRAAGNGDLDKVIELRNQWNYQNKKGETALHVAVAEDQLEVVAHLVSHGAPVNTQDKKNRFTPLMLCLAQQPPHFLDMLQTILKAKPDLDVQDSTGQTILHLAAQYEELDAMELLLRAKPKVDAVDPKRMTALHVAAGKNNLELVQLLVERGRAHLNAIDAKGNTPLSSSDAAELLTYLIGKGAKPLANALKNSPLHAEAMHCDVDATWPTAAARVLLSAFPDLATERNARGRTPHETFEQGADADDDGAAPTANSNTKQTTVDKRKQPRDVVGDAIGDNAAAARAAAIARTKKKTAQKQQLQAERNASAWTSTHSWIAFILAVLVIVYSILTAESSE